MAAEQGYFTPRKVAPKLLMNLYEALISKHPPGQTAVFSGGRSWNYGEIDRLAGLAADHLLAAGAAPGDRIVSQTETSPESLWFYLGCLRAGLVYLPLNTAYTADEVGYFLADARPRVVISSPEKVQIFSRLAAGKTEPQLLSLNDRGEGSAMEAFRKSQPESPVCPRDPGDLAAVLYTSGTTGRSKGAMLSHGNLLANEEALCRAWGWQTDDVMLHALPLFHVHGLFLGVNLPLMAGAKLHLLPGFDPEAVIRELPESTVFMGVPTYYTRLLASESLGPLPCRSMRLFISGSAPLSAQTFEAFQERTGHRILERYGMTETGMNITNPLEGERRPGTVGLPLPGVTCRIVDSQGRSVAAGETGMLEVKGGNVFQGYWQKPVESAKEFTADGFFRTGDLASCDEDGYFRLVGRGIDLIISGGLNVYPKEVEEVIDQLPEVMESAVIGVPHPDFGEAVTAVVVPARDADKERLPDEIQKLIRERLANFKRPKRIHLTGELPRNTMGKVQKQHLREIYANDHQA